MTAFGSELFIDSRLLQDSVRGVPGADAGIYSEVNAAVRAGPNTVVAFPATYELATVFAQFSQYLMSIIGHPAILRAGDPQPLPRLDDQV